MQLVCHVDVVAGPADRATPTRRTETTVADEHVNPTQARLAEMMAAAGDEPGPLVMLNLNTYRDWAEYPPGHPDAEPRVTGREAYLRYGVVAAAAVEEVGGRILWGADVHRQVIGCDHDDVDEVVAVWYPSTLAFLRLIDVEGYAEATVHRDAGLVRATLLQCTSGPDPVLRSPFDL